ncbi:unnamed protein product [Gemmata massiliana]|uniref:DUF1508 domain-containing protein n=1 Tax=Gemmata massiliana TaxID=1210884 RepID=A0A6P2CQ02_9BACT|nr:DUF1508 domain-containing protein [Gemmata massiliana]VTR91098.1 unnamed protein product [Gemmata massiliana]
MRTALRSFALFAVVAALIASTGSSPAPALQKKTEEVGTIEVYKAKDGWRFRIKNTEGKSVAIGTVGYEKKEEALKEVEFLKATFAKGKVVEVKEEKK